MAKVKLENISRRFEGTIAIEDINLDIPDGEFWVLVGPSGCGKSTILRTIAGLEAATEGKLYIGDVSVAEIPARERNVAMVFQNYALYPHMTVAENLGFGLQMRRIDKGTIDRRVGEVAKSLSIDHLLQRKPKQLSGGQQQRVALGRAIVRQAEVFLLDEPLSNLDAQLRDETRAELKQLHQKLSITTIYVTHDQTEAMTLADRLVVLDQGKIQQIGTPQDIYNYPRNRMVATFLGSPPMNILRTTYLDGRFSFGDRFILVSPKIREAIAPVERQAFDLGIRPEAISIEGDLREDLAGLMVRIETIEPLGKEILLRCSLSNSNPHISLLVSPQWSGKVGDLQEIKLNMSQITIFDAHSGETLYPNPLAKRGREKDNKMV
jgi:multiple sugar transport system ATP-binding protein